MKTGDVKLTLKMKSAHTKYVADFGDDSPKDEAGQPFDWPSYLEYNGYKLDRAGHVYEMDNEDVAMKTREMR